MRQLLAPFALPALLLLLGCPGPGPGGGGKDSGDMAQDARPVAADGPATGDDGPPPPQDQAAPMTCDEIRAAYEALVGDANRACRQHDDCQVLSGQCGAGLGSCYHAVNRGVSQERLNLLGERYREAGCTGAVCRCPAPPTAECRERRCELKL